MKIIQDEQVLKAILKTDQSKNFPPDLADIRLPPEGEAIVDTNVRIDKNIVSTSSDLIENIRSGSLAAISDEITADSIVHTSDSNDKFDAELKGKKVWMKAGGPLRKEPRVGSDFQVDL